MSSVEDVIQYLCEHKLTIATAESCTAGMMTSMLADVPGCASILDIGFVVYTEHAKHNFLGVNLQTINLFGLTSEEVAREMALGALKRSNANFAVAITGTAESDDELNGVVCFAYAFQTDNAKKTADINDVDIKDVDSSVTNTKVLSETITFRGERNQVRNLAAMHAITSIPAYYKKFSIGEGENNQ